MSSQFWLVNTRSGGHRGEAVLKALANHVEASALDFSKLPQQLEEASQFDRLVVVGGDGTFASVLTSANLPPVPVGLIPLGTANDLAREFGMFRAVKHVDVSDLPPLVDSLVQAPLAVWNVTADGVSRSFCNYCSLGFEGAVVHDFAEWRSTQKSHGVLKNRLMYGVLGIKSLATRLRGISIRVGEEVAQQVPPTRGIIATNVKSHMGIGMLTPSSDPGDETIECVNASSFLDYLKMVASPLGLLPPLRSMMRGRDITIDGIPSKTHIQIDGEAHPPVMSGTIRVSFQKIVSVLRAF